VAIGIALDARYSVLAGLLTPGEGDRIRRLLVALGFDLGSEALRRREPSGRLSILKGLRDFQEHLGGELTVTLLSGIGTGVDVHAVDEALVEEAVGWLADGRG
jgi:3-dehydroquinate synthase